jgi:hydroxymethylglutaryl-CoA synthase
LFELCDTVPGAAAAVATLQHGRRTADYVRFLSLTGALDLEWGARAEFEQNASASVRERYGRDMLSFIGGRDQHCNVQFPKSRVPVNPDATGPGGLEDVRLSDERTGARAPVNFDQPPGGGAARV